MLGPALCAAAAAAPLRYDTVRSTRSHGPYRALDGVACIMLLRATTAASYNVLDFIVHCHPPPGRG
jgi:hypothetical protein